MSEALAELGLEIRDVTVELRQHESRQKIKFPWREWVQQAAGRSVAVYVDASTGEHENGDQWLQGAGVGVVVQIAEEWWTLSVPLPAQYDTTTGETIGLAPARAVTKRLAEGAGSVKVVYNAQAAAQILEASGHRQRHPVRRAVHVATPEAESMEWGVRSHQEEKEDGEGSTPEGPRADRERRVLINELADEGAEWAARMSAEGKRASLPLAIEAVFGVLKKSGEPGRPALQRRIHTLEHWREPRSLHPRIVELRKEFPDEILTVIPAAPGHVAPSVAGVWKICEERRGHNEIPVPVLPHAVAAGDPPAGGEMASTRHERTADQKQVPDDHERHSGSRGGDPGLGSGPQTQVRTAPSTGEGRDQELGKGSTPVPEHDRQGVGGGRQEGEGRGQGAWEGK